MDASFSTIENMTMLKENGFEYLSVTRSKLKDYTVVNPGQPREELKDNRGNKINVEFVTKTFQRSSGQKTRCRYFLYIRSDKKAVKEASMEAKFSSKFEAELLNLTAGLSRPRGTKKYKKWQKELEESKKNTPMPINSTTSKWYKKRESSALLFTRKKR